MNPNLSLPWYAKASLIIIGLIAFTYLLVVAKVILAPLIFAGMIAMTISPFVDFLVRKKINRILAITISLLLIAFVFIAIALLLSSQVNEFTYAFPKLIDRFYETINIAVLWTSQYFNISTLEINTFFTNAKTDILNNSWGTIGMTFNTIAEILFALVLIPVYVFMMLFYSPMFLVFIRKVFGKNHVEKVDEILNLTKKTINHYLIALLLQTAILAVLNSVGLLIIGLKYAIILGIIGALLNLIPYLGGLIGIVLYIIVALFTKDSISYVFYVLILYSIIQLIDNNLIVPKLVGSKVKINALVTIIAVIVGGALWGIGGMFLSIPFVAILKIIFDHIESLKPLGFLLGDTMPEIINFKISPKKKT